MALQAGVSTGRGPRAAALAAADPLKDINTIRPCGVPPSQFWGEVADFPEVDAKMLEQSCWREKVAGRWHRPEPIHLLEGRACLTSVRCRFRGIAVRGRRVLALSDSLCCVLAFAKGRATDNALLQICRQRAACVLLGMSSSVGGGFLPSSIGLTKLPDASLRTSNSQPRSGSRLCVGSSPHAMPPKEFKRLCRAEATTEWKRPAEVWRLAAWWPRGRPSLQHGRRQQAVSASRG